MAEQDQEMAPEEMEEAPAQQMEQEPEPEDNEPEYQMPGPMVHGWWALSPTDRTMINMGMKALKRANMKGRKPGSPLTPALRRAFGMRD